MTDTSEWKIHRAFWRDGVIVVDFLAGNRQAMLSFERGANAADPSDEAREVIMLGGIEGPWHGRPIACVQGEVEAKRLLQQGGYA